MKRFFLIWGWIFFPAFFPTVFAFGNEAAKITEIRIVTPSWPDQTNEDGTGLFFDIVRSVYEPAGIKMTYKIFPWKRAEAMIASDEADAMLSALKRKDRLTPEYPLWVEYTAVVFRKDKVKEWKGLKILDNKRSVWLRGYDFHTTSYLKSVKLDWEEIDAYESAWKMLEKGRTDFYIDALADIEQYIKKNKPDMNVYQVETIWGENAYMSFSKSEKSKKLIEIYDKRIIELFKSGELKKIFEKWNVIFPPEAWKKSAGGEK